MITSVKFNIHCVYFLAKCTQSRKKTPFSENFSFSVVCDKDGKILYAFVDVFDNFTLLQDNLRGGGLSTSDFLDLFTSCATVKIID